MRRAIPWRKTKDMMSNVSALRYSVIAQEESRKPSG